MHKKYYYLQEMVSSSFRKFLWAWISCLSLSFYLAACSEQSAPCGDLDPSCARKAEVNLSVVPTTVVNPTQRIKLDASNSVFDELKWSLDGSGISECKNQVICFLDMDEAGTFTIKVEGTVAATTFSGVSLGTMGHPESEDSVSIEIQVGSSSSSTSTDTSTNTSTTAASSTTIHASCNFLLSGMVACFPLTGASSSILAGDFSGNGLTGTVSGALNAANRNGTASEAYQVQVATTTQYLSLDSGTFSNLGDFTILMWVKLDSLNTGGINTFISVANATTDNSLVWYYDASNDRFAFDIATSAFSYATDTTLEDLQWHFITLKREGNSMKVYVDAVQNVMELITPTTAILADSGGFIVGQEQDSIGGTFDLNQNLAGKVDDLRVYNRALSDSEISNIYGFYRGLDATARRFTKP